jgi:N-acetylglucosaminyldiphosphoundecaprenol N-acetyl-beta-D-mannosaminyltransferase
MAVQLVAPPRASAPIAHQARERVDLLGTGIDAVPLSMLDQWIEALIASGEPHQVITANLDFVAIARRRPEFARLIAEADLVLCDGKPLQWASQLQGRPLPSRITGVDLVLHTAQLSAQLGYRIFLFGARAGVAERAAARLEEMFPGVQIAGWYSPPEGDFDADETARILRTIRESRADALFVALGAPRQDFWIAEHMDELGVPLCAGIGGVFNFLTGEIRRAPDWVQRAGLEWAHRLVQEPSRLWKRYLLNDLPIFAQLVVRQVGRRLRAMRIRVPRRRAPSPALPVPRRGNLRWSAGPRVRRPVASTPLPLAAWQPNRRLLERQQAPRYDASRTPASLG